MKLKVQLHTQRNEATVLHFRDEGDLGKIPWRRKWHCTWRIPWTDKPGRLTDHGGHKESGMTEHAHVHNISK